MIAQISTLTCSKLQKLVYEDLKIKLIHTENNKKQTTFLIKVCLKLLNCNNLFPIVKHL